MTQSPFSIALCDDDALFLEMMKRQICVIFQERNRACEIILYQSAKALLDDLRGGKRFSLLMLDVIMDGLDGMELARFLHSKGDRTPVILISCNRDYALTGYEADALRFLAKPIDPDRLREALTAAEAKTQTRALVIRNGDGLHRVEVDSIVYAEVWERGVLLHLLGNASVFSVMKIGAQETMLPKAEFFRCHQGYIVHLTCVRTIRTADAYMSDGSRVPVSRYKLTELRERFTTYLNQ